jgi:hypothetical protein
MKGVRKMNFRKVFLIAAVAVLVFPLTVVPAMAGADPPVRPATGTIHGPDVWGVGVIACNTSTATLRVKQIGPDCIVAPTAKIVTAVNCPADERDVLYYQLTGVTLNDTSGAPISGTPIFVRIKNFQIESDNSAASFDVLINFYSP